MSFLRVAFAVLLAASVARADDKCKIATKGDSPVAKACASGGVKDATKKMKELVKAAKAKGVVYKCDSCHKDMDAYELTEKARDDFKKLLEAAVAK